MHYICSVWMADALNVSGTLYWSRHIVANRCDLWPHHVYWIGAYACIGYDLSTSHVRWQIWWLRIVTTIANRCHGVCHGMLVRVSQLFTIIADGCRCYCGVIAITIATDCHCHWCIAILSHCYCCCCRSDIFYEGWCIVFMSMRPNWIWIIVVWSMIRWWF